MNLLSPLDGLWAAWLIVAVLAALAVKALWDSRTLPKNHYRANAIVFAAASVGTGVVAIFIGITEQNVAVWEYNSSFNFGVAIGSGKAVPPMPATPWLVIVLAAVLVLVAIVGVVNTILRHQLVQLAASLVGLTGSFTVFAFATYYRANTPAWALITNMGWIATSLAVLGLCLIAGYTKGRSDERKAAAASLTGAATTHTTHTALAP